MWLILPIRITSKVVRKYNLPWWTIWSCYGELITAVPTRSKRWWNTTYHGELFDSHPFQRPYFWSNWCGFPKLVRPKATSPNIYSIHIEFKLPTNPISFELKRNDFPIFDDVTVYGNWAFPGWAFVSSPLCLITMVGGDSSPTSSIVVVFPHLCHTSSYVLLVFPHLPMKSFQCWEISF